MDLFCVPLRIKACYLRKGIRHFWKDYLLVSYPCQAGTQFYERSKYLRSVMLGEGILVSMVKVFSLETFLVSSLACVCKCDVCPKDMVIGDSV